MADIMREINSKLINSSLRIHINYYEFFKILKTKNLLRGSFFGEFKIWEKFLIADKSWKVL